MFIHVQISKKIPKRSFITGVFALALKANREHVVSMLLQLSESLLDLLLLSITHEPHFFHSETQFVHKAQAGFKLKILLLIAFSLQHL